MPRRLEEYHLVVDQRSESAEGATMATALPVMHANGVGAVLALADGSETALDPEAALNALAARPHLVCHAAFTIGRLALSVRAGAALVMSARDQRHCDIAELFAFVEPARPAVPLPASLAAALGLDRGGATAATIRAVAGELLARLGAPSLPYPRETGQALNFLARANWPWADAALKAFASAHEIKTTDQFATGLNAWDRLEEWDEEGPRPPGRQEPVSGAEAQSFLAGVLGSAAEARPQQMQYCAEVTAAFAPRHSRYENEVVLAEAGTGLGKTLGYLAPSWLWARSNNAAVWISTYTKNLQRQLEQETARIVTDPQERQRRVVIRKGRENYVCLLNLQEAFARMTASNPRNALLAALVARWVRFTRDGDMVGGDFPTWLMSLFYDTGGEGRAVSPMSLGLTDRRGECIYSACQHYRKCFIERVARAARKADIVIANHALVLHQVAVDQALGPPQTAAEQELAVAGGLRRLVFDEGHQLFDAADSAFSAHLTALETAELRRWILGPETRGRRGRSLADRLGDLTAGDAAAEDFLQAILSAARALPGPGFMRRLQAGAGEGEAERFLALVRQQVLARANGQPGQSVETDCRPVVGGLNDAAEALSAALDAVRRPMRGLATALLSRLDSDADELSSSDRARIEALARSLRRRGELMVAGWVEMLNRLLVETDPFFVEWFAIEQQYGREFDIGMHSHWIDPTEPLARAVIAPADGVLITSATLKDRPPETPDDWENAEMRTGAVHLPYPVTRVSHASPFDYRAQCRLIVVNDVSRDDMDQVAAAYRELFRAAGGGALGLFTAISRLRAVHRRLLEPLASAGLPLYAQHADPIDIGTLVDMFRAETNACLLGTDAVRDGVDVPGESLRLIVLDRVPWPVPTILERARREAFGGSAWIDMNVRLRLRQAFGRLIRRASDHGVFVVLDSRLASRFRTAFPDDLAIERMGLVDAIDAVRDFAGPLAISGGNA